MRKTENSLHLASVLLAMGLLFLAASCSSPATQDAAPPAEPTATEKLSGAVDDGTVEPMMMTGNAVRGGLLYDTWWTVLASGEGGEHKDDDHEDGEAHEGGEAPEGDHPLWATQSTNTRTGDETWRCKECHGWDYKGRDGAYGSGSHATGFPGVFDASAKTPEELLGALTGATNPGHDFSMYMGEDDLNDLVAFLKEGVIDYNALINVDKSSTGNAAAGEINFSTVCAKCHGPQGNAINFDSLEEPEFLGHVAPDNPWEFVHKVRFGQPGWPMPSAITNNWSLDDIANVLAYAQTLTSEPAVSGGGPLYDKWWESLGLDVPEGDQPLWATQSTNTRTGDDTWRCKECHGWDYLGSEGVYGSGSHSTGFGGILNAAILSGEEILAWLNGTNNEDHDFSPYMDEVALNALVTFVQTEISDRTPYINADGTVNGDPANGRLLFEGTCTFCHGVDGREMNFGSEEEPEFVGTVAADNPWEFFHKASFGQPGAPMPSGIGLGWSLQDIADLLAYAQTLPTK